MQTFCAGGITDFQFIYLFFNIDLKTAYLIKQQFDCYCSSSMSHKKPLLVKIHLSRWKVNDLK